MTYSLAPHDRATGADPDRLLSLDAATYQSHPLHRSERVWTETNCYVDVWVEVLHALGHDPIPAAACVFSSGFEENQWTFLKFSPEDLRRLYGIDVAEMNIWRPVLDHVVDNLRAGVFTTVEVDSFWLPDTGATTYRVGHVKSTIIPNMIDRAQERMGYFHNAGYFELHGADFRAIFHLDGAAPEVLPPYVERVRLRANNIDTDTAAVAIAIARDHLARRPADNPVAALGAQVRADAQWLRTAGVEGFHVWSFGLVRQCGAAAELAADVAEYLECHGVRGAAGSAAGFRAAAHSMKTLQFRLARLARGRAVDIDDLLDQAAADWQASIDLLTAAL
jgi:hypothetical protein